ncbi:MAG: hypothetical protein MUF87_02000 [Anaerolineae bacterium]|nr:hypothetical protein [Anaerolineae bacterium]
MTFPEDRVLIGVINRKRDLEYAQQGHWYRIPKAKLSRGLQAEYLGFFLSNAFGDQNGSIHYFGRITGLELVYRRWLLPEEPNHKNADDEYYKISLAPLQTKSPPIHNETKRAISFIYTTWDRFIHAEKIADLYSRADYFVDRIYHALRTKGMRPERFWEVEQRDVPYAPGIQLSTMEGPLYLSMMRRDDALYMDLGATQETIIAAIRQELAKRGGLVDIHLPSEGI